MQSSFTGPDGLNYVLSEETLDDQMEFESYVQYREWTSFRDQFHGKGKLTNEEYQRNSDRLFEKCASKSLQDIANEADFLQKQLQGIQYHLFLSLRKHHPEITLKQVGRIITSSNVADVYRLQAVLNGQVERAETDTKKKNKTNLPSLQK